MRISPSTILGGQGHGSRNALWAWRMRLHGYAAFNQHIHLHSRLVLPLDAGLRHDLQPVSPADYVELRALNIAAKAIKLKAEQPSGFKPGMRILRLWPFRWPTHTPPETTQAVAPDPDLSTGLYLDILS